MVWVVWCVFFCVFVFGDDVCFVEGVVEWLLVSVGCVDVELGVGYWYDELWIWDCCDFRIDVVDVDLEVVVFGL